MNPSISVIIPNYNRAHMISRALDSVLSQSLPATEIIVVDDGSNDNSITMIERLYPAVRLICQTHQGVSAARNKGINIASGEWLALLDSDDEWMPDKLEKQIESLQLRPRYKLVHNNEIWFRKGKPLKQLKKHRKYGGNIFRHCLPLCIISPSSVVIHREVFKDVGLFNENMPVCEDYDMWLRICARYPVLFIDEALTVKYGGHADQLSQKLHSMDKYRILALADILKNEDLQPGYREAAIKTLISKTAIYIKGAKKHGNLSDLSTFETLQRHYADVLESQSSSDTGRI